MSEDMERRGPEGSWSQSSGANQAPNVKPKLSQRDSNSKEEQQNNQKPRKVRRSRSSDSERVDRGRRREQDRHQGESRRRGRSEESRRRDSKEERNRSKVKKPLEADVEDAECAVCFCTYDNVFKTPKLLACGHTFCLECLARINVTSSELKTLSCPVCREHTKLPHGQDLPRLGNNQDIIGKLPPGMQRVLSIRFKRSKGKLLLKNPPPSSPIKSNVLALPKKSQCVQEPAAAGMNLSTVEQGVNPATVVDVGRPPSRVRGRLRRLFRSDRCYYAVVAAIITITVALVLLGILAFMVVPSIYYQRPVVPANQTIIHHSPQTED